MSTAGLRIVICALLILVTDVSYADGLRLTPGSQKENAAIPDLAQQETRITGKVMDEDGKPLPAASILVVGSLTGAMSEADGSYAITVPSTESTLEFSFVGYVKQQIRVGTRTVINVQLVMQYNSIADVVVVGYATEQKALLTGSIDVVSSDAIRDIPVMNIDNLMQGQASGVQVTQNSGTPGGATSVRIRGVNSISGSNQPLYVIDGIPVVTGDYGQVGYEGQGINAISDLNPNDIESISILKDAAAASIYGARASNGVIVITTKRGANQKTQVSLNSYYGVQQVWRTLGMLDARGWMEYRNDLAGTPVFSQEQMENITIDTDWQDVIFRTAPNANYELTANGGNDNTKFFLSGDYFTQDGILIGTDYQRLNGRVNIDHNLTDKFTVGASVGLTYAKTNRVEGDQSLHGPLPNGISTPAIYPVYNEDGSYNQSGPYSNAVSIANEATNQNFSFRTLANSYLTWHILPGLNLTTKWGADFLNFREHAFEFNTVQGKKYNGLGFETYTNVLNIVSNNVFTYDFSVSDNKFGFLAGYSFEKYQDRSSFIRAQDYADESLEYINSASTIASASSDANNSGLQSYFGKINYDYKTRYIVSLSGRFDSSTKFGENNRTGFFPAASVAWRIGEEAFMDNLPSVSELKMRASYGLTGNDDIPHFLYAELYGVTSYNSASAIYPSSIPNPDLKWETTAHLDIGLDLGLLDNRIFLTVDYYDKQTKDLLLARPLPGSSGFSSITENIGQVENKGLELNLTTNNLVGKFKWNTQANLSINRNKVLKLYNGQPIDDIGRGGNRVMEGQPIGIFYSYEWLGIDPSTGDCVYTDLDNNDQITTHDRKIVGNPHPDFTGGITNNFSYLGFDLSVFLQFSYGNDIFNGSRLFLESLQGGDNQVADITRRWQQPGDITDIPRATTDAVAAASNKRVSSRFIEDGSYLRIKNLTLGYTFSDNMIRKLHLSSLRLYITSQNLFTFTRYSGLDPEVNYRGDDNTVIGTDFFTYPAARSLNFGINLKF